MVKTARNPFARCGGLLALLCSGCTLVVDHQLSQQQANCPDLIFLDGSPNSSGQRFHGGVQVLSFRGPAWPPAGKDPASFGATLAFLSNGGLVLGGGLSGDTVFMRSESNYTPTWASLAPGHEGPQSFGCTEILAGTYDTLHDRTALSLIAGDCGNDISYDGGVIPGPPESVAPAIAWSGAAAGGLVATLYGGQAQSCPETFPLNCFPPRGGAVTGGGPRRVDSMIDATGAPVWIVSTEGNDVKIYNSTFAARGAAVSWAGPIAVLASDVAIVMRIHSGNLEGQLFDATGAHRGNEAHFDLGDPAAHGLEIARLGTAPVVRAAWIGGDGKARIASYDASVATAQRLTTPAIVCGSQGASFVAPTSATTAAVLIGDSLYLRHVD